MIYFLLTTLVTAAVNYTRIIECLNNVTNVESFVLNSEDEEITFIGNDRSTVAMYNEISDCYDEQGISKRYVLMTNNARQMFIDAGQEDDFDEIKYDYGARIDPADYPKYFQELPEPEDGLHSNNTQSISVKLRMRSKSQSHGPGSVLLLEQYAAQGSITQNKLQGYARFVN